MYTAAMRPSPFARPAPALSLLAALALGCAEGGAGGEKGDGEGPIDEAVDIAKEFSTEESRRFVNGILDSYMSELGRDPRKAEGG